MDLDDARVRILQSQDVPPLSDILLDVLRVIGDMDDEIGRLKIRVQDLERETTTHER